MFSDFKPLEAELKHIAISRRYGRVVSVDSAKIHVEGLSMHGHVGDQVKIEKSAGTTIVGEIISLNTRRAAIMPYGTCEGIAIGDLVELKHGNEIRPSSSWIGRIIDSFGQPLDGRKIYLGEHSVPIKRSAPEAAGRRALGPRLNTTLPVFNTILPIARGQRIGIFAGSGVGKSSLLAELARGLDCDLVIIALIGERGRELKDFVEHTLGAEGMKRAIVVAVTSDQSPLAKRRAAWTATAIAEHFRDQGKHVLLLMDSITRFAEAHREVALTAGEAPSLRAYPPSTASLIAGLTERAGPGPEGAGDITAIFTVLVAGSDMEEPIADITRGVLDGHIILAREIAERGRFPAIDVSKSVSRCLPATATAEENSIINEVKSIVGTYEKSAPMINTGLYSNGTTPLIDNAIVLHPKLEEYFSRVANERVEESFEILSGLVNHPDTTVETETN